MTLDVDNSTRHIHRDRYVWPKHSKREFAVHKYQWSRWWHTFKAFHNKRDGHTFAEVVQQPSKNSSSMSTHRHDASLGVCSLCSSSLCVPQAMVTTPLTTASSKTSPKTACSKLRSSAHALQSKYVDPVPTHNRFVLLGELACPDSVGKQYNNSIYQGINVTVAHGNHSLKSDKNESGENIKPNYKARGNTQSNRPV